MIQHVTLIRHCIASYAGCADATLKKQSSDCSGPEECCTNNCLAVDDSDGRLCELRCWMSVPTGCGGQRPTSLLCTLKITHIYPPPYALELSYYCPSHPFARLSPLKPKVALWGRLGIKRAVHRMTLHPTTAALRHAHLVNVRYRCGGAYCIGSIGCSCVCQGFGNQGISAVRVLRITLQVASHYEQHSSCRHMLFLWQAQVGTLGRASQPRPP